MKQVHGYMSEDGTFFESKLNAERHDYEMTIRGYCVTHTPEIDAEKLMFHLEALADTAIGYINVTRQIKANLATEAKALKDYDNKQRTEKVAPVLEQSVGGDEPVPNVGRRPQPKGI